MSARRSGTATVTDVAQLAGVSVATVSRILNGTAQVTADKRAAVEAAIGKLQFRPNLSARSLRSGSTKTIGILTQDFESPYFVAGTKGVERGLDGSGYAPLVVPGHWNPQEELDRARLLMARRVDAIVILGGTLSDAQLLDMATQQPIAVTGRQLEGPQLLSFHADQVEGARLATQHLIALGHRAIAHIAGPNDRPDAIERQRGYLAAHRDANLSVDPRLIVPGNYMENGGEQALEQLLAQGVPFSAVFCANDQTLWGARLALHHRGLRVPEDCSLVGFDDIPASRFMTPPVTSVRQPIYEMGRLAAESLLAALRGEALGGMQMLPLELIVRGTTAAV
jgi:LacI family transcriptional regulator